MVQMESTADLQRWLAQKGIDVRKWGQDGAKRVVDLWQELTGGDARLQDDPPRRHVEVVQVIIRRGHLILVEAAQELSDGQRRTRQRPPSEKMKAGETYVAAALRCLQEELGVAPQQVELKLETYRCDQTTADSPSYPGLPTLYTVHTLEAVVLGLPQEAFWRENVAYDGGGDPVKRHLWDWQDGSTVLAGDLGP
jgi:hypothetical protein